MTIITATSAEHWATRPCRTSRVSAYPGIGTYSYPNHALDVPFAAIACSPLAMCLTALLRGPVTGPRQERTGRSSSVPLNSCPASAPPSGGVWHVRGIGPAIRARQAPTYHGCTPGKRVLITRFLIFRIQGYGLVRERRDRHAAQSTTCGISHRAEARAPCAQGPRGTRGSRARACAGQPLPQSRAARR